jgi:hypothetical protein
MTVLASDRSWVSRRIAAVKSSEPARQEHTHENDAQSGDDDILRGTQIKVSNAADENITDRQIEKAPKHIDGGGGKPLATRLGKRTLKRTAHHAADKMRNGVGEKGAAKEV